MKKRMVMASALLLSGLLSACSSTTDNNSAQSPNPAPQVAHRTIIFVWDGMRPDAINPTDTPNLYALKMAGVNFTDNHSTYPTMTMMNAASFATGSFPGTTGFYGNTPWNPGASGKDSSGKVIDFQQPTFTEDYAILRDMDNFYSGQLFLVDTLFKKAQAAGLKTAVVGKSGPAFLQDLKAGGIILDERHAEPASFANSLKEAGFKLPKLTTVNYPNGEVTLSADNGDPTAGKSKVTLADKVTSDPTSVSAEQNADANTYMMTVFTDYILLTQKPNLSLVWLRSPDSTEHSYGVGTAPFRDALRTQDKLLGQLQARLKAMGELENTNIIVVSDHAHSNVAGDASVFPLRKLSSAGVGDVDPNGYSVSGDVRTADLMTRAGFKAYDGSGCIYDPVMSGIKADGSHVYPDKIDTDGSVCGAAGAHYTTPAYKVPAQLSDDAFVIAANGGSDYLYQPKHNADLVKKAVAFLQARPQYGAIFVDDRYGNIPGTLPLSCVKLENAAGRNPDIMVSFTSNASATVQGFSGTLYESASNNRGQHGSFGSTDVHNMLLAYGPNFKKGMTNNLPSGNVDVAPTVAHILGFSLPQADGRVLREALVGDNGPTSVRSASVTSQAASGLTLLTVTDLDGKEVTSTNGTYNITLQTKSLSQGGKNYTYFDSALATRK